MKPQEERSKAYFTDFDGRFRGRLSAVIPKTMMAESKFVSAKYDCRAKVEYQKDLMGLLEEGMLLAVRNFKPYETGERYTLMEISRVWPEHFGLRGLRDSSYYPMQFEIIQQSEGDWSTDDRSAMMIQISSIPINYDLLLDEKGEYEFKKGFSYPVIAGEAYILNSGMINRMYNQNIVEKMDVDTSKTTANARADPRLGVIKMFETSKTKIPIYIDFESLVRYHFGVFAFTGGGKSNMLSNILRRLVYHTNDTKIVIFDISCEYPFLLMDVFSDENIPSRILFETKIESAEQLYSSVVKPKKFEKDKRALRGFEAIIRQGKIGHYIRPRFIVPTYREILEDCDKQKKASIGKPTYTEALNAIYQAIIDYISSEGCSESGTIDEDFVKYLDKRACEAMETFKVSDRSNVYAWATTRSTLLKTIEKAKREKAEKGFSTEDIERLIESPNKLTCLSIADPFLIKELAISISAYFLRKRKRQFRVKPYILFVFDEAQEFVPATSEARGIERDCTDKVETLLRQGRKYGLGGCIATQRIAYLNTNALQQLHTYFVGTLPRPYDRSVVSNTFTIDQTILEKTLEFAPGEWLLSSYIATGMENVPIFIKADNAENELEGFLLRA
ncbi:MAG: ATP-binding protein [Candidatus Bathyarchaeota archaeon]|nr:MAG: ATP-binding protein [Candidatus Bathyarchaeota archaeon]